MKFPKFSVISKVACASAFSSFLAYSYLSIQQKHQEMATKSCADECRARAQKLKLVCPPPKFFVVTGNWKMNGDKRMVEEMIKLLRCGSVRQGNEVIIGVPAPYLDLVQQKKPKFVEVAGQNIYKEGKGAFTGEISADMLLDIGVTWVILGASERRIFFNEDYDFIGEKAKYALDKGLKVVLCVGETASERECKEHIEAIQKQLSIVANHVSKPKWRNMIIAYEPLWTIGTGKTATADEAQEVAAAIKNWVTNNIDVESGGAIRVQYGGPLTPSTAKSFAMMGAIDGLYVGAPSLKAVEFLAMINANSKDE